MPYSFTRWAGASGALVLQHEILDALDEERSEVEIAVANNGSKFYDPLSLGPKLVFKESIVGSCHIFRMKYSLRTVIFDEEMR